MPKSDIEIARAATMKPINEIADRLGIPSDALLQYGPYKAKLSYDYIKSLARKRDGKLILVTAITPTPAGEGKTTIAGNLAVACRPGRRGWDISSFCKWWQIWQNINNAKSCQFLEDSSLVVTKPMFATRF